MISKRQKEAVLLAGQGYKNREIAIFMHITEYAVVQYMDRAFKNLNVHTREEAYQKVKENEDAWR
jgi:DNA-binding CsgD family transcriptional regulator